MKLLNRLRDLRAETIAGFKTDNVLVDNQYDDLLGVGTTTCDDILRLNIADNQHQKFDKKFAGYQD